MHKSLPNTFIFLDKFDNQIFENNSTNIGIIYRNYHDQNKKNDLIKIAKKCKRKRFKLYIANNIKLAIKVKANGIYIPAFNKNKRFANHEKKDLTIIGSAHNQKEIQQKILQDCSAIFLAPIFQTIGIGREAATITVIGITLGVSLGGGFLIDEVKQNNIRKKDVLSSMTFLLLSHSLIEDTLVVMALMGGHFSGVLVARVLYSIVIVWFVVALLKILNNNLSNKLFFKS